MDAPALCLAIVQFFLLVNSVRNDNFNRPHSEQDEWKDPCHVWGPDASNVGDGVCFILHGDTMEFDEAVEFCHLNVNGHLAEPKTIFQFQVALSKIGMSTSHAWIGVTDLKESGTWHWNSDEQVADIPHAWWKFGEPDHEEVNGASEHCVVVTDSGLRDTLCGHQDYPLCQASIYSHYYLAALPSSALSLADSALLFGSHALPHSGLKIGVEVTTYPNGTKEMFVFDSHEGFQYPLFIDKTSLAVRVQSSLALHLVLVLWRADLSVLASSLMVPGGSSGVLTGSRLGHPTSGLTSLAIVNGESKKSQIKLAFSGRASDEVKVNTRQYRKRSWMTLSSKLGSEHQIYNTETTNGYDGPPFIHLSHPGAVFMSEQQKPAKKVAINFSNDPLERDVIVGLAGEPLDTNMAIGETGDFLTQVTAAAIEGWGKQPENPVQTDFASDVYTTETPPQPPLQPPSKDVTLEQVLSTSQIGMDYVTIPSLPLTLDTIDVFTVVAVYNQTFIKVLAKKNSADSRSVLLQQAGDTVDLGLPASHFRRVVGSRPFYLYARLGAIENGVSMGGACEVTLLAQHLWADHYSVQMDIPWTLLQDVYLVVVGRSIDMATVTLTSGEGDTSRFTDCQQGVTGPEHLFSGCFFKLSTSQKTYRLSTADHEVFAAYMYGRRGHSAACHQLGMNHNSPAALDQAFDADRYLESLKQERDKASPPLPGQAKKPFIWVDTNMPDLTLDDLLAVETPACVVNVTLTQTELKAKLQNISNYLKVDSKNTSLSRRKVESAPDGRTSSVCLAAFSCGFIVMVGCVFVLMDVINYLIPALCKPRDDKRL